MALATYKDLCIDAVDPARLGRFWAETLALDLELLDDGDARLTGPTPQHTVWVNRVPEPVTVKQRVHVDVWAGSVAEVEGYGATLVRPQDDEIRWSVLADPEGGELCVFTTEPPRAPRHLELVVDTGSDPTALAGWWATLLDAPVEHDERGFSYVHRIPGSPLESIAFVPVPEPKTVKNRIHVDLHVEDLDAVVEHGATVLRAADAEVRWHVLADPEGNELCVFTS